MNRHEKETAGLALSPMTDLSPPGAGKQATRWTYGILACLALVLASPVVTGCAKPADGAILKPSLDLVAAGDTAKIYVSWTAATKATGALLTVTVTNTNGTWTALPVNQVVTAGGTATVVTMSLTADSARFQAFMSSTAGAVTSAAAGSNIRQWIRKLQPPVVNLDSLIGLIVAPPTVTLVGIGSTQQMCAYYKFASGHVVLRAADALGCAKDYATRFSIMERAVTNTEQTWTDKRCINWTSSNPTIASVTTDLGCTGLRTGLGMMGVPIRQIAVQTH